MRHAQDELVWVDSNGIAHPLGLSAGEQMRRRKERHFRLMPTPDHVIFMRFTGQDGRRDEEDGAVVRLAGEIVRRVRCATCSRWWPRPGGAAS
jgi:hypothetical protein